MRRSLIIPVLLTIVCTSPVSGQQPGQARLEESPQADTTQVDPALWKILEDWSRRSSGIRRLEGSIARWKYDLTFGVEYIGEGRFYYEEPDKGRLDLSPRPVTPEMLEAREQPGAKVHRKGGKPFELQSDQPEKWVCDGLRVISMDVEKKSAHVSQLPEELRGTNIMNGPLPFLFGLPPREAVRRFRLKLVQAPSAGNPYARLHAVPKQSNDAQAWKEADVILDTRTGLPAHVQLIHPSGTFKEVYSFSNLKQNDKAGGVLEFFRNSPFKVSLRGYQVNQVEDGAEGSDGGQQVAARVMPNLVRLSHKQAKAKLQQLGLKKGQIRMFQGKAASAQEDVYRVQKQIPAPGTPLSASTEVSLLVWDKMQ